jgi:adenylate cyclase class IV
MEKTRQKKKYRISYSLEWVEFDIDKYDDIPTLLEIEATTTKEIKSYIKDLWLSKHQIKRFWSRWLYKFYWLPYSYLK